MYRLLHMNVRRALLVAAAVLVKDQKLAADRQLWRGERSEVFKRRSYRWEAKLL